MKKKVLSMLVTFAMLLSMLPATALATDFNVTDDGNGLDDADSQEYYKFDEVANITTADDRIIIKENMEYTLTEDTKLSAPLVVDGHSFTLDLDGKTLTVDGDNKFSSNANVTIKNGTLSIDSTVANGDAIFCVGDYSSNATLNLENVNVEGENYSSAYAVFYVYGESTLNMTGGSVTVSDDSSAYGGVFKAESSTDGKINITGTEADLVELTFDDAKIGFLDGTVEMNYVDLDITGGANAINQSALTVKNSSLTISGANGRALTLKNDVTVENSTLNFSNCSEGEIRFKAGVSLTTDEDSTITTCTTYADSSDTGAKINGKDVTATVDAKANVTVDGDKTTIVAAPIGTVTPAYVGEVDEYVRIWGEGGGNAKESLELKLFAGDTLIATTELNNKDGIIDGDVYVTWNFYYPNSNDSYWTTTWEEGHPNSIAQPTRVELYVDGKKVAENVAKMSAPDGLTPVVWRNLGGVEQADLVESNGVYTIHNLKELQIFRNTVNAGNNYANKTVKLADNIDLGGKEWTPIGTSKNPFNGTFDGQDHTISNLVITGNNSDVGLFGYTTNGEVKNFTLHNAKVTGYLDVGAVAGTPYTSKYTNIKVTGHVEVNGMAYVGGVGGKNAYADWTGITVDVDESSYVKAISTENGKAYRTYVGGVIGFMGEGNHTFKNIKSNINVIGDVCDIGGIAGIAHYGNKFENIECTGDVINSNSSDPLEETETGGICGVWHNQAGTSVSFDDCKFTGTVTVNGVVVTSNNLTGGAYNPNNDESSNSGSLIVDGEKLWPLVAEVKGVQYGTLSAAIAAAEAGDVVTLLSDAAEVVEIENGAATIDLNNKTLTGSFLIKNGEFEIKNGSIVNKDPDVSGIEINAGALTLTDVNVTSARHALRVDGKVDVTVDGGEYKVSESAKVMTTHAVNVSGTASVTIKDGTFTGPKGLANDSGSAVCVRENSSVVITGGTFTGGKNDTLRKADNAGTLTVAGGEFDQDPTQYLAEGYYSYQSPSNRLYYVKVDDGAEMVAEVNGVQYETLKAAVAAADAGNTILILDNVTLNEGLNVAGDDQIIIDLNGMTVSYVTTENKADDMIVNKGDLTITDSSDGQRGKLSYKYSGTPDTSYSYDNATIQNEGNLTIKAGTVENTTGVMSHASYAINTNAGATLNVKGGKVLNSNGHAIRQVSFGTAANVVNISGGYIEGTRAVQFQLPGSASATTAPVMTLNITGGELKSNENTYDLAVYVYSNGQSAENASVSVSGDAVINGNIALNEAATASMSEGSASVTGGRLNGEYGIFSYAEEDTNNALTITGGTFATNYAEMYAEDGYVFESYVDGEGNRVYGVKRTYSVTITVTPADATIVVKDSEGNEVDAEDDGSYVLTDGTYTYSVTKAGYNAENGNFTVAGGDKTVKVSLSAKSSGGGGGGGSTRYTITVEDTKNGDITVSPSRASSGSTVTITVDPDSGYELDELTVLDKNGKEIKLTRKSDSKYTFKMPSGKVTIEATFAEIEAFENPFTDVAEGAYYYDAVLWAAENGITGGTSATTFGPNVTVTRAQMMTFLWRAHGSPKATGSNPFTDVSTSDYYYDAVLWAVANGITSGISADTFGPNNAVTRAQAVTFQWRASGSPAVSGNSFGDVSADAYYANAVAWAVNKSITGGTGNNQFSPDMPVTRAQAVTFLYRELG